MKSGLEGRNNVSFLRDQQDTDVRLNEVRPRRPEQCWICMSRVLITLSVSMKSGLEGRNNPLQTAGPGNRGCYVSMKSGLEGRNNLLVRASGEAARLRRLNEVRPRRPEQLYYLGSAEHVRYYVSMKSGLEGRNNRRSRPPRSRSSWRSQ